MSRPVRIIAEGDAYRDQLLRTSALVAEEAGRKEWSFSFQSESPTGEPWLGPDILDHLADLCAQGVQHVLVCPVGFVSDHLEIRWDIDVEAQEKAAELGMQLERIEMPNADPAFVATLAEIVRRAIRKLPPKQRATLMLRAYQELTHEEIARILGSSVGAVKANFFHALGNLRRLLQQS